MTKKLKTKANPIDGNAMLLHLGYFENFKGANTILVCGDGDGLQRLAEHLRSLEDPNTEPMNLHLLPFVQVYGGVSMTAHPVNRELGVRRIGSAFCFAWHHSQEGWLESAEKIEVVARGSGGHCYFGEAADQEFDKVRTALATVRATAFTVAINGIGTFQQEGRPQVLRAAVACRRCKQRAPL
jgi:hypothetical protein